MRMVGTKNETVLGTVLIVLWPMTSIMDEINFKLQRRRNQQNHGGSMRMGWGT